MIKGWKAKCMTLRARVAELEQEIKSLRGNIPLKYQSTGIARKVIKIREANPCASLQVIGSRVDLSRERVRQILNKAGLPTIHVKRLPPQFQCLNCEQSFSLPPPSKRAKGIIYDPESFCSRSCAAKYHVLTLTCETCGITFQRPQSHLMNNIKHGFGNHFFCSRHCFGKWVGRTAGFIAHPENCRKGIENGARRKKKWDYEQVWALREKTGWGAPRLSQALGIPEGTIFSILAHQQATTTEKR